MGKNKFNMKRITIFLIALLLIPAFSLKAQSSHQHIGITVGPSMALSDFAKTDLQDSTSGFAKTGVGINFVYAFRMSHNLGFQLNISYNSHNLDNVSLSESAEELNPGTSFSVGYMNPWNTGNLLFGPYIRFPITSHFSFDVRGLIGFNGAYSPDFTINGTTSTGEKIEYQRYAAKSFNFGYSAGAGFKYRVNNYYILLFGDYSGTNAKFNSVTGIDWNNEPYEIYFTQKISTFRISVGFAYIL